jgi:hypothetical protein
LKPLKGPKRALGRLEVKARLLLEEIDGYGHTPSQLKGVLV